MSENLEKNRIEESRTLIKTILDDAYNMYLSHEPLKNDSWRDCKSWVDMYGVFKQEEKELGFAGLNFTNFVTTEEQRKSLLNEINDCIASLAMMGALVKNAKVYPNGYLIENKE
jgi:hypothetical protein